MNDISTYPSVARCVYDHEETWELVDLVNDAIERVRVSGEAAFREFSIDGSWWRKGETYIFVLDPEGSPCRAASSQHGNPRS